MVILFLVRQERQTAVARYYDPGEKIPPFGYTILYCVSEGGILPIYFEIRKDTRMMPGKDPTQLPPSTFYENLHELGLTVDAVTRRVSLLMK